MKQAAPAPARARTKPAAVTFACFWIFQLEASWKVLPADGRMAGISEARVALLAAQSDQLRLRGAYSLAGLRADAHFILWWLTQEPERLQDAAMALRRCRLGDHLRYREVYLGMGAGSQYTDDHQAAFAKGDPPRRYLSVYPFSKTPEWYLLPFERRRALMAEHGAVGKAFDVATNTVQAFGLGDAEFIVALESDSLAELVRCVEALRKVEVRRYTRVDVPIYLGRLRPLEEILGEL